MPKVLISTVTATGHVAPLLPIARALIERGHDVRWLGGARHKLRIEATGARFIPYRHARDIDESRLNETFPERVGLTKLACLKFDIKHVFLEPALDQLRDIEAAVVEQPCDVMIADLAYLGAQLHHARTRTPLVVLNITALLLRSRDLAPAGLALAPSSSGFGRVRNAVLHGLMEHVLMRDVQAYYERIVARAGVTRTGWFMDYQGLTSKVLQPSVPGLEYARSDLPPNVHFIGLLPPEPAPDAALPAWFGELDGRRPVVHVTQGTVANQHPDLFQPALQALANQDALVVITTGNRAPRELGLADAPANVRVAPFLPYAELMPRTTAMLTNGGYGGVQIALSHGVPVAVAGDTEEKPEIAARVAYSGAGLDLGTGKPTPLAVRRAVRRLLDDGKLRARAQKLAAEYAHYDALRLAIEHIEQLI